MRVMAIDPGSNQIGIAVFKGKRLLNSGTFEVIKTDLAYSKLLYIHNLIKSALSIHYPDIIIIESLKSMRNAKTTRILSEIIGAIKLTIILDNKVYDEVHPKTMKKVITGNGNADKEMVKKVIIKKFKKKKDISYDESDAIGLGYTYIINNDN